MLEFDVKKRPNGSAWIALRDKETQLLIAERTTLTEEDTRRISAYFELLKFGFGFIETYLTVGEQLADDPDLAKNVRAVRSAMERMRGQRRGD